MARTFRVSDLVTRAKRLADEEKRSRITDPEWRQYVSEMYEELYFIIVETGMRHFEKEETISADGTATYALPSDHFCTIGVDYEYDNAGQRIALHELMVQERNLYTGAVGFDYAVNWSIPGENLKLHPGTKSGQTYYHVYIPQPQDFSDRTVDGVDTTDDELDIRGHRFQTGQGPVQLTTSDTLPAGISASTNYWVRAVTADAISLHTTQSAAEAGTGAVTITDGGAGTHTVESDVSDVDVAVPFAERFLAWGCCVLSQAKEESSTGLARAKQAEYEEKVRDAALMRALEMRRRVTDTYAPGFGEGIFGEYLRGGRGY